MEGECKHQLHLENRKLGRITGVTDVRAFDENEIRLETGQGILHIQGKELHVGRLQLDRGEVDIEGQVKSLTYQDGKHGGKNKEQSLLERLFR